MLGGMDTVGGAADGQDVGPPEEAQILRPLLLEDKYKECSGNCDFLLQFHLVVQMLLFSNSLNSKTVIFTMTITLNADLFTVIYSYIFDFEVLRTTATAVATNTQHPLRTIILRRLLQLPLRLESGNLDGSKALIVHFMRNPAHAHLVRDIAVVLGPSRKTLNRLERLEDLERAIKAEALVELLPELLRRTRNLERLDWANFPPPSSESLKALSALSRVIHLSIDCFMGPCFISHPNEVPDTTEK
jgi:hypothetical protein